MFSSPTFPQTLLEFEPATFSATSLAFLTSGLLPHLILDEPLDSALMILIVGDNWSNPVLFWRAKIPSHVHRIYESMVSSIFRSISEVGHSLSSWSLLLCLHNFFSQFAAVCFRACSSWKHGGFIAQ